jgi:nucleoid DNA-binding protein
MKKEQLAKQLAKETRITTAAAADQVDVIVSAIVKRVRRGQSASLPGLGTFLPGRQEDFHFDHNPPVRRDSKKESR